MYPPPIYSRIVIPDSKTGSTKIDEDIAPCKSTMSCRMDYARTQGA